MNEVKPVQHIETQIRAHILTTCWGICKEKKHIVGMNLLAK